MKLVTIDVGAHGIPGAVLCSGEILHLPRAALPGTVEAWLPGSIRAILEAGEAGLDVVRGLVARVEDAPRTQDQLRLAGSLTSSATRLLAPITEPRLIIGGGLNYRSHLAEMAGTPEPSRPTGFVKIASSVTGPNSPIIAPPHAAEMVDWEGELACVIGRICHNVAEADAMACIAGYTVVNDISARDWVEGVFQASEVWDARMTWELNVMGKNFAGFTAMGPYLVTADEVGDPAELTLQTRLNGEVVQEAHTSDVVFGFAASIAFYSRFYTLQPGDVLTTGTPAGVGVGRKPPVFMHPGDMIEVEVSRIGVLRNTIVA